MELLFSTNEKEKELFDIVNGGASRVFIKLKLKKFSETDLQNGINSKNDFDKETFIEKCLEVMVSTLSSEKVSIDIENFKYIDKEEAENLEIGGRDLEITLEISNS